MIGYLRLNLFDSLINDPRRYRMSTLTLDVGFAFDEQTSGFTGFLCEFIDIASGDSPSDA